MYERDRRAAVWVDRAEAAEAAYQAGREYQQPGMYPGEWLQPPDLTADVESYAEQMDDLYKHVLNTKDSPLELMDVNSAQLPIDRYCREAAIKLFLERHGLYDAFLNETPYGISTKTDEELNPVQRDIWWLQLTSAAEPVQLFIKYVPKQSEAEQVVGWEYKLLGYHYSSTSMRFISRQKYEERVLSAHRAKPHHRAELLRTLERP